MAKKKTVKKATKKKTTKKKAAAYKRKVKGLVEARKTNNASRLRKKRH
ncbi:MAG: hypothetical protein AAGC72_11705 [Planctomycetota bacterium]